MPRPKKYSDELRERAVRLVFDSQRPIAAVARDLGVHKEALPPDRKRFIAGRVRSSPVYTKGQRMLSDVLRDRLITVLGFWDADRDGAIEESDYAVAAGRMAGLGGFAPGSAEYEQLHGQLVNGGWQLMRQFDSNGDGRVTIDEALEGFDALYADQQRYREVIIEPCCSSFDLIDTDHDGQITAEEHRAYLIALSVDEAIAETAFEHLDLDRDGFLSREEFVQLTDEFYTSDDPDAAGTWLFGKAPPGAS